MQKEKKAPWWKHKNVGGNKEQGKTQLSKQIPTAPNNKNNFL